MSVRRLILAFCACLGAVALRAAETPSTNAAGLTERQTRVLNGITHGRFGGSWTDLSVPQLDDLQRRADAYCDSINRRHLQGGLVTSLRFADTNWNRVAALEDAQLGAIQTGYLLAAYALRYSVQIDVRNITSISNLLNGVELLLKNGPKPGFIPRYVGSAGDPAYQAFYSKYGGPDPARPGLGKLAFTSKGTNGTEWVWLGGAGRDDYAAINFGLGLVNSRVRDPVIRERSTRAIRAILSRLESDAWRIDDGHGSQTFLSPLLRAALLSSGTYADSRKYTGMYKTNVLQLLDEGDVQLVRYSDYASNVSEFANYLLLTLLEKGTSFQPRFRDRLSSLWRLAEPDLNPFLASAFASSLEGEASKNPGAVATIQGMLSLYPPPPRSGTTPTPAPNLVRLSANGREWSRYALQLSEQPVAAFQWMQSPYELPHPTEPTVVHPGVDFVASYWIAREGGGLRPKEERTSLKHSDTNTTRITNLPTAPIKAPKLTP